MYSNILLALDGSPTSDRALLEALKIADVGSKITAITVVENPLVGYSPPVMYYDYAAMHDAFVQQSKYILDKAWREVKQRNGISIETHIIDMSPNTRYDIAGAIENAAVEYHANIIVMGTHGWGVVDRFFLGGIAEQVVRQSHLPVLLVRMSPKH